MLRSARPSLSVCLSHFFLSLPFARWRYAYVAASNAFDRGQRGAVCPRPNAISWEHIASQRPGNILFHLTRQLRHGLSQHLHFGGGGSGGARGLRRVAKNNCRLCVQICSLRLKPTYYNHNFFNQMCPVTLIKNFIWGQWGPDL